MVIRRRSLEEDLQREKLAASLRSDLADKIEKANLLEVSDNIETVLGGGVFAKILAQFLACVAEGEAVNVANFLQWCSAQNPPIFLEKIIVEQAQLYELGLEPENREARFYQYEESYRSEVLSSYRLEKAPALMPEDLLREMSRFRFRVVDEPEFAIEYDNFLNNYFVPALRSGVSRLDPQDAQIIRWGIVKYFNTLLPDEEDPEADDESGDKVLDFMSEFVVYFSDPKNEAVFLDLRMSKSLEETLWFTSKVELDDEAVVNFGKSAIDVADVYWGKERSSEEPKHPNSAWQKERASAFEHFMSVARFTLGVVDSLLVNSKLIPNGLVKEILSRADYKLEILYTALLHDVLEDLKSKETGETMMSEAEVRGLLRVAGLGSVMIDQVLKNLNLLNAKRHIKGEKISIENYTQEILDSDNPVVLMVKYADILHNSHSETKSKWLRGNDSNQKPQINIEWLQKQKAYDAIIQKVAIDNPVHVRPQDLIKIASANPELFQFKGWKQVLNTHPQKASILGALQAGVRTTVTRMMADAN